jgi:hypothetical protein
MGKVNGLTVLMTIVVQLIVGYLWYGSYLFGDIIKTAGGHAIDFLQTDVTSLLLLVLSSFGLTHILDGVVKHNGTKDVSDGIKTGLIFGIFGLGLPLLTLLNLMGVAKIAMLVIFMHLVIMSILTTLVVIKTKKD